MSRSIWVSKCRLTLSYCNELLVVTGKIAFANVVSDIYATGVIAIDTVKLVLSIPDEFTEDERNVVVPMMIDGFRAAAKSSGCALKIGNFAVNPWCLIGGVATSICQSSEIIM